MLSLVFKKLNLQFSPVMLASGGVNSLATSHTIEHLSSTRLHNWSHDKPILYFISHCLNQIDIVWNPYNNKDFKIKLLKYCKKKVTNFRLYLVDVTLQNVI